MPVKIAIPTIQEARADVVNCIKNSYQKNKQLFKCNPENMILFSDEIKEVDGVIKYNAVFANLKSCLLVQVNNFLDEKSHAIIQIY